MTAGRLNHLSPAAARLGQALARPKPLAVICVIALAALGWLYLGLLTAGMSGETRGLGPGMVWLDWLPRAVDALCRPTFGVAHFGMPAAAWSVTDFILVALMWCAMVLAMMLPSAGAMILAYAEIADTAARKGERVISPFILTAGYAAVWLGFALLAAAAQAVMARAALLDAAMLSVNTLFSGAIFLAAGLYQFTALKHACLSKCQRPFPFFFVHWSTTAAGVFRLGLSQGLYCLGCCWAMMLVMFAVGVMNVAWMAALGAVMTIEKLTTTARFAHVVGVSLIGLGAGLVAASLWTHWPAASL